MCSMLCEVNVDELLTFFAVVGHEKLADWKVPYRHMSEQYYDLENTRLYEAELTVFMGGFLTLEVQDPADLALISLLLHVLETSRV